MEARLTDNSDSLNGINTEGSNTATNEQSTDFNPFTRNTDRADFPEVGDRETTTEKRKPGRPKGSGKAQTEKMVNGQVGQTEVKKGRPKKQVIQETEKFLGSEEAQQISTLVLSLVQEFGKQMVGEQGEFNMMEATILNASLPAYLATMKKSTVQKVSSIAYPMAIIAGFSAYSIRIGNIRKERDLIKTQSILTNENVNKAEERLSTEWNNQPYPTPVTPIPNNPI